MEMTHPGLPLYWGLSVLAAMLLSSLWFVVTPTAAAGRGGVFNLTRLPLLGGVIGSIVSTPWILLGLKMLMVAFFLTIIVSGLFGTPVAERNFATMLTWNLWWAGLVFSILLFGSAWCALCPWDALAHWLVRRRLWKRADPNNSLNLKLPRYLNNVWPALILFVGLTWLELGVGITTDPYATAILALVMVVMATVSMALFRRKAFCRNFCPVGRTIGVYSQMSALELRPIDANLCADCKTLECYYGNQSIESCPTWLVMGRLRQNTYCTSCGNCTQSCPVQNIAWRLRTPAIEATQGARPKWDEASFMISLLALTAFHGITMMPFWEQWMWEVARVTGDSGRLLWSFSIGLVACLALISGLYAAMIALTRELSKTTFDYRRCFSAMAFISLPLAFSYHMAHNLNHLVREGSGTWSVMQNPLGSDTLPLTMAEKHQRHLEIWISQDLLFTLQAVLMITGFVIALQIIRYRGARLIGSNRGLRLRLLLAPVWMFTVLMTGFHLWMLMQPMVMRM